MCLIKKNYNIYFMRSIGDYMKKLNLLLIFAALMCLYSVPTRADTVQLDLLSLGCPTELTSDTAGGPLYWQKDFDLGVTFSEISHVSIDWSGGITAGLRRIMTPTLFSRLANRTRLMWGFTLPLGGLVEPRSGGAKPVTPRRNPLTVRMNSQQMGQPLGQTCSMVRGVL